MHFWCVRSYKLKVSRCFVTKRRPQLSGVLSSALPYRLFKNGHARFPFIARAEVSPPCNNCVAFVQHQGAPPQSVAVTCSVGSAASSCPSRRLSPLLLTSHRGPKCPLGRLVDPVCGDLVCTMKRKYWLSLSSSSSSSSSWSQGPVNLGKAQ